jgi:hypothetical protein
MEYLVDDVTELVPDIGDHLQHRFLRALLEVPANEHLADGRSKAPYNQEQARSFFLLLIKSAGFFQTP